MDIRKLAVACSFTALALTGAAFAAGSTSFDPVAAVRGDLATKLETRGLEAADVADFMVTSVVPTKHNGLTHVYIRQRVHGLEVLGAEMNFNLSRRGGVMAPGGSFVPGVLSRAERTLREPAFAADEAVIAAARAFGLGQVDRLDLVESAAGVERRATFSNPAVSRLPIPVRLAYLRLPGTDDLRLVWNVTIQNPYGAHWWDAQIDAESGELLAKVDWTNDETYGVYASPAESPDRTSPVSTRTDEVDPYDYPGATLPLPSPFGWHDTNGAAGPEFTTTRGNNVHACDDIDNNNNCAGGIQPDGTATLDFSAALFPIDLATEGPFDYTDAAVINLFYWNNIMHDVTYRYGFDEAGGNFQANNYGNGGLGGDAVNADAQDGSGTDNANFSTPPDGQQPRMQMYRWTFPFPNRLTINSPGPIAGDYFVTGAAFGPPVSTPITADMALVIDAVDTPNDGCTALTNGGVINGKIAMAYRGNCNFTVKAANAQAAGAVALVVVNNLPNPPGTLGGTDPTVTIPAVHLSQADGAIIVAELGGTVNGTIQPAGGATPPERDSDLDAGVIAHEYGHGISIRLTGGPANVGCVTGNERMGEGWSDWMTLFLHAEAADTEATTRAVGTYLTYEDRSGFGIRRFPYSTSLAINPLKYGDIDDPLNTIPHGVGAIWANMLWEMYWNLVDEYGYDPDIYEGSGGNNLAFQLVMDGMKLQPCNPGFVDGRNAILLADKVNNCSANQCRIWDAFAKRAVGVGASQGSSGAVGDETPSEVLPFGCPNQIFFGDFESDSTACWSATSPP